MRSQGARRAHYSFALPGGNDTGRYQAFRMICPKSAVTAVARFTVANSRDPLLTSASLFLVPTTTLTYAATDVANHRYFCPIPIGRLHCYFETPSASPCSIAAEFAAIESSGGNGEVPQGTVIYQSMWGTALDVQAKAQETTAAPVRIPIENGAARYHFHPAYPRLLIDVDFTDLPKGAVLRRPLTPLATRPTFPPQYLAVQQDFFLEGQYRVSKKSFTRLKFPEATLTSGHLIGSPKILAIAGEFLMTHLSALSGFTPATEQDAMEVLNSDGAEEDGIILVE